MVFRYIRPDAFSVWNNKNISSRFSKYKGILDGTFLARFLIAKSVKCDYSPEDSLENLEILLQEKSKEFKELLKEDFDILKNRKTITKCYLDLVEHIAFKYLENCVFCERKCGVNRIQGDLGICMIPKESYVSSSFIHHGEEAPLVPSGTIFFQGCNFECVFCQNYDISQAWKGRRCIEGISQKVDDVFLAEIAENLADKGAKNINYVGGDPIPNIHTIIGSLKYQKRNICQLWNSNFYLTSKSLSLIIDLMDFWLPDFKYGNNDCGLKYSGVKNYFNIISRNHKKIHDEGSGEIIIRHLVMPNHVECCSKPILDFIARETPKCVVNIMGQYRPEYQSNKFPEINRKPTSEEMKEVQHYAEDLNILYKPVS